MVSITLETRVSYRLINDLDVNVFNFKRFGKELPKRHKLSPHSFIQVALQLAYYRSAMTPHYCPGRGGGLKQCLACCPRLGKHRSVWRLLPMLCSAVSAVVLSLQSSR